MKRLLTVTAAAAGAALHVPADAHRGDRDADLPEAGVFIEGIGVDERAGVFYVSATNRDGTIYRGRVGARDQVLEVWQPPTRGRQRARDRRRPRGPRVRRGRPAAEVRVFDRRGRRLAELPTGAAGLLPQRRLGRPRRRRLRHRLLAAADLARVRTPRAVADRALARRLGHDHLHAGADRLRPRRDRHHARTRCSRPRARPGQLWRIDLRTRRIAEVDLGGVRLTNADGIVLRGRTLWVVQNFSRQITRLKLRHDFTRATRRARAADARRPHVHDGQARARQAAGRSTPSSASRRPPRSPRTGSSRWSNVRPSDHRGGRHAVGSWAHQATGAGGECGRGGCGGAGRAARGGGARPTTTSAATGTARGARRRR